MHIIEELTERNRAFASNGFTAGLGLMPSMRTIIVTCVDPRVDPAFVLGLKQGEAVVIRNLGGRFVPSTLMTMGMLRALAQIEGADPNAAWNIVFLHHTDCGIAHLAHGASDMLAAYFGVEANALESLAIADPHAAVRVDVAAAKANPRLPANFLVSGLVYDVATGLVEVVEQPAPLRSEEQS